MKYIVEELDQFGCVAGPVINKDKKILKWLGPIKHKWNFENFGLYWANDCIKYLGVYIGKDSDLVVKFNWESKLEKIQRILDNWRRRNLTIIGRVLIIKTLLISQIVHLIMFLLSTNSYCKKTKQNYI